MTRHRASVVYGLFTLAICLLALSSSCGSEGNAGLPAELRITSVDIPAGKGDEAVSWTVSWEGGIAPYTISINTGGGALEDLPAGTPALSPFAAEFILVNGSFYLAEIHAYLVVITDANGNTAVAQGSYDVEPAEPPQLSIDDFSYDAASGLLRVVADADGWSTLLAELTLPAGWIADASEREMTVSDNEAIAEFYVYPEGVLAGGAGDFDVKVFDPDAAWIEP